MTKTLTMVGRAERISISQGDIQNVPAKVDTGAYRSSIWATNIHEKDGQLHFCLLGPDSDYYSGKIISVHSYKTVEVENSFGQKEERYSVYITATLAGRSVRTNFTLADRSQKTYPVLIGRKMLRGKFIVNVAQGEPISDEETS